MHRMDCNPSLTLCCYGSTVVLIPATIFLSADTTSSYNRGFIIIIVLSTVFCGTNNIKIIVYSIILYSLPPNNWFYYSL